MHTQTVGKPNNTFFQSLLIILAATLSFVIYVLLSARDGFSPLEPLLNGTAPRPYVYRVLAPVVIRTLSDALSLNPYVSAVIVMYVALVAFSFTAWRLANVFLAPRASRVIGILAPLGLIPFMFEQRHIYDLPTLFFFRCRFIFWHAKNSARISRRWSARPFPKKLPCCSLSSLRCPFGNGWRARNLSCC